MFSSNKIIAQAEIYFLIERSDETWKGLSFHFNKTFEVFQINSTNDFSFPFKFRNFPRILPLSVILFNRLASSIENRGNLRSSDNNSRHNQSSAYLNASFHSLHNGKSHLVVGRAEHGTQKPDCVWSSGRSIES